MSGKKLIKLLKKDKWVPRRRTKHGISLSKKIGDVNRVTIIPDTRADLPEGTLQAILGPKQTGIGKRGLRELVDKYGL
jgi:predicted RNA binding protein YcfA (HicA-like mRNA interferase family)